MNKLEIKLTGELTIKVNALLSDTKKKNLLVQKEDDREYFLVLEENKDFPDVVSIEQRKDGQAIFSVTGPELQQLKSEFE